MIYSKLHHSKDPVYIYYFFFGLKDHTEKVLKNRCLTWLLIHVTPQQNCATTHFFYEDLNGAKFEFFPILYHGWHYRACIFSQWNVVDSCNTQRCHQSLFGWDSKGKTDPPWEAKSYGRKGSVFEAWVNEALLLIWGVEERMSERMPVMQTFTPADGSFHSKDKCYITAAASTSNNSRRLWGGEVWNELCNSAGLNE